MSDAALYALAGAGLYALGLYGLIVRAHLLRKLLAFNIMSSGVFLALVALGQPRPGAGADPVPQALVLTGIVVAFASTALALVLLRRWFRVCGVADLETGIDDGADERGAP